MEHIGDVTGDPLAETPRATAVRRPALTMAWWVVHISIIGFLGTEVLYCGHQVFGVLSPPGHFGPLGELASEVPMEVLIARRLYAIEAWIAGTGLCIYLALTEILPRRLRK